MTLSSRTKKILLIIVFILVTFLLALALYFVFFRPVPPPVVIVPEEEFPGGLPIEPGPGITLPPIPDGILPPSGIVVPPEPLVTSTQQPIISSTANGGIVVPTTLLRRDVGFVSRGSDGNSLNFYDNSTGLFSRLRPTGEIELLTSRSFRNVDTVSWSPISDKAVIEFRDGSNIIYNFVTNQSYTLPSQYTEFSFSPDGTQVAAKDLKLNQEDRWLVAVDDRGSNRRLLEHLGRNEKRVQVKWSPNNLIVATSSLSIDADRAELIFLTNNGAMLNKAIVQGRNLQYEYSPSGNQMVYSASNSQSNHLPRLWLTSTSPDAIDTVRIDTGLNTWAHKCAYANEVQLYCAVPKDIGEYSGVIPTNNTSDDLIYVIDTRTGNSRLAAEPIIPARIDSMIITKDASTLFYVDTDTQSVNKINL